MLVTVFFLVLLLLFNSYNRPNNSRQTKKNVSTKEDYLKGGHFWIGFITPFSFPYYYTYSWLLAEGEIRIFHNTKRRNGRPCNFFFSLWKYPSIMTLFFTPLKITFKNLVSQLELMMSRRSVGRRGSGTRPFLLLFVRDVLAPDAAQHQKLIWRRLFIVLKTWRLQVYVMKRENPFMDIDDDVFKNTAANGSYTTIWKFAYKSSSVIEDAEEKSKVFYFNRAEYKKGGIGCVHYHRGGWAASKLIISVRQSEGSWDEGCGINCCSHRPAHVLSRERIRRRRWSLG